MSILMTALALAASTQAASGTPAQPADHAQHEQGGTKHSSKDCCCKEMANGKKMACCEEHKEGAGGDHADHASH